MSRHQTAANRPPSTAVIRDVWKESLETEFSLVRSFVRTHPIVAMDVEFPGVVARSITNISLVPASTFLYSNLRCNVDLLTPIQVGISLANAEGQLPVVDGKEVAAWQFNFRFSVKEDMYNSESIALLERAGIKFEFLAKHGIFPQEFGELLISSGLILSEDVTVVNFHGGFAMAYMLKLMTGADLPHTLEQFCEQIRMYLPVAYDLRTVIQKHTQNKWQGASLEQLAKDYAVAKDAGLPALHNAGVDSYLALKTYFAMLKTNPVIFHPAYSGLLFGLEPRMSPSMMPIATTGMPPLALSSGGEARHLRRRGTSDMMGS